MPVDYFVLLIPLAFFLAVFVGSIRRRARKPAWVTAVVLLLVFLGIYFVPGWVLQIRSRNGDTDAQYRLGVYYWTRMGYMWSDIETRDKWWLEAAKGGHPHAMYQVGYSSMFGSSKYIPKDLDAARKWLESAVAAGDQDAKDAFPMLVTEETNASGR